MNNILKYFYNMDVNDIKRENNCYRFIYNEYQYKLYIIDYNINEKDVYLLSRELLKYTLVSEIIINNEEKIITNDNHVNYILLKIYVDCNKLITFNDILYLNQLLYKDNMDINWGMLWSKKIDYLENLISENEKKYPIIMDSFNYFSGMTENAIAYYNNTIISNNYYVISHRKIGINSTLEDLYNPLNIIFDYRVRDISEYTKVCFFRKNKAGYKNIIDYFNKNNFNLMEIRLFVARLLYPSFYFDLYEDILINGKSEKIILPIVRELEDYQLYLGKIIAYLKKKYEIEEIWWLKKHL